MTTTE